MKRHCSNRHTRYVNYEGTLTSCGVCTACVTNRAATFGRKAHWESIADSLVAIERTQHRALRSVDFMLSQKLANWTPDMVSPARLAQWGMSNARSCT